jgi:hypothetical protein
MLTTAIYAKVDDDSLRALACPLNANGKIAKPNAVQTHGHLVATKRNQWYSLSYMPSPEFATRR